MQRSDRLLHCADIHMLYKSTMLGEKGATSCVAVELVVQRFDQLVEDTDHIRLVELLVCQGDGYTGLSALDNVATAFRLTPSQQPIR